MQQRGRSRRLKAALDKRTAAHPQAQSLRPRLRLHHTPLSRGPGATLAALPGPWPRGHALLPLLPEHMPIASFASRPLARSLRTSPNLTLESGQFRGVITVTGITFQAPALALTVGRALDRPGEHRGAIGGPSR